MEGPIGSIYILTNKAFPTFLKIGYTCRSVEERVKELSSPTGVPFKFEIVYSAETFSPHEKEQTIHDHLQKYRVSDGKKDTEFFELDITKAIAVINKVINPPTPPTTPDPPDLTPEQKAGRSKIINSLLVKKYQNRIKNIEKWINKLEELLAKQNEIQKIRTKTGFLKRKFNKIAEPNLLICDELKRLIEKSKKFKNEYTIAIFLKEHASVKGIEQIPYEYPSKMIKHYFGSMEDKIIELENEYGVVTNQIKCTIEHPFVIEYGSYFTNVPWKKDKQFKPIDTMGIGDWDSLFWLSLFEELKWLPLSLFDIFPDPGNEYLCSDSEYNRCWKKRWEIDWWKKVDPEGICSTNPYRCLNE